MTSWSTVFIIISKCFSRIHIDSALQLLSNGTKNTQIEVWMTKLWLYEIGVKTGELQQCRDVENQRHDIAESAEIEHPDVAMLPNDVTMFGVGFGLIFSPFWA